MDLDTDLFAVLPTARSDPATPEIEETIARVLVVDDSGLQRRILAARLQKWGHFVRQAASGEEALALCAEDSFDLVICDWMMPGMTGVEFCRRFRETESHGYVYVILLTSKSEKDEVARGLESGADDFVTKPVSGPELRARINAAARILRNERALTQKNAEISRAYAEIKALYSAVDRDLNEARKLQHSLLRERQVDYGTAEAALILRSCGHVGGDLVGQFRIDETRAGLFALDVSGHGIASALLTARLAGYLSNAAPDQNIALARDFAGTLHARPLAEVAAHFNRMMLDDVETEHYFTMIMAHVDLTTGRVDLIQAGHPLPVVQRASGEIEVLGSGGMPIGLLRDPTFEEMTVHLAPGDRLLLASDGVTECRDVAGECLGEEGLIDILRSSRDLPVESFFQAMMWDLTAFAEQEEMQDDVSGVLLEYRGQMPKRRR
jgi:sigma-B regulation protein RsbU (phosphoserine phosphatase)